MTTLKAISPHKTILRRLENQLFKRLSQVDDIKTIHAKYLKNQQSKENSHRELLTGQNAKSKSTEHQNLDLLNSDSAAHQVILKASNRSALKSSLIILMLACGSISFSQNQNVNLIANVNDYPSLGYNDVWGYTTPEGDEYALLGTVSGVSIVSVSDPENIAEVDYISYVPAPPFGWYDIKTYQNFMYISTEGSLDMLIYDLSTLPDSASLVGSFSQLSSAPHNIFIDTEMGILYAVEDFNFNLVTRIYSLADPMNPVQISSIDTANGGADSHDLFAQDSVLYIAEGLSPTIGIFDVSDPANPSFRARFAIPDGGYAHQVWVSENNKYMVTTEETPYKTVKVWDIQDLDSVLLVSEYLGGSMLAHNAYIDGNVIYIAHYEAGLKMIDFSDPTNVAEIGFYDTYPDKESPGFEGAWGVYPFTGNGMIFVSDIQTGLYILQFEQEEGPQFVASPGGIDFGNILVDSTSDGFTITVQNFGTEDLIITDISDPGMPFILGQIPDVPLVLLPKQSEQFTVSFAPLNTGFENAIITITSNDANDPKYELMLNARGFVLNAAENGTYFASTGRQGNTPGSLLNIDIATGAGTLIGSTGLDAIPGLAINSSGDIYATSGFSAAGAALYRIDAATGGAVLIGNTGQVGIEAIAFDGDNELYGVGVGDVSEFPNSTLFRLDVATGASTPVDTTGVWIVGLAFDPTDGTLWGSSGAGNFASKDAIYTINKTSGVATRVGKTGLGGSTPDIHFDLDGNLYGSKGGGMNPNNLIVIDKTTGTGTIIGPIGFKAVSGMSTRLDRLTVGLADDFRSSTVFERLHNFPNPFSQHSTIKYTLLEGAVVRLQIYNVSGQLVRTMVNEKQSAGPQELIWYGVSETGIGLPNGTYIYTIEANHSLVSGKMVLMR